MSFLDDDICDEDDNGQADFKRASEINWYELGQGYALTSNCQNCCELSWISSQPRSWALVWYSQKGNGLNTSRVGTALVVIRNFWVLIVIFKIWCDDSWLWWWLQWYCSYCQHHCRPKLWPESSWHSPFSWSYSSASDVLLITLINDHADHNDPTDENVCEYGEDMVDMGDGRS